MTDEYPYDDMFSLQPLVERVTVEKKVFDTLQKNNLDLMERLEIAKEALKFYAADENYYMHGTYGNTNIRNDNGKIAKEALKEIDK